MMMSHKNKRFAPEIRQCVRPEVPQYMLDSWQKLIDKAAKATRTPAVLVTQVSKSQIQLRLRSTNADNPFLPSDPVERIPDFYCDQVVNTQQPLLVRDAAQTRRWCRAPQYECGMSFYLGYPVTWSDQHPFGTICVMDETDQNSAIELRGLIEEIQTLMNNDLALLEQMAAQKDEQANLLNRLQNAQQSLSDVVVDLEEYKTTTRVLLRERDCDRQEIKSEINAEFSQLVAPLLLALEKHGPLNDKQAADIDALRRVLNLSLQDQRKISCILSPTEMKVAKFIQQGCSSKQIAGQLHLSKSTIDFHRQNLRRKLDVPNRGGNLRACLQTLI